MYIFWCIVISLALGATFHLLRYYRRPTAAVAWLFAFWALPILGVLGYLMFAVYESPRRVRRRRKLSRELRSSASRASAFGPSERGDSLADRDEAEWALVARTAESVGALPLTLGNAVGLHPDGKTARSELLDGLRSAQREILIETYIWTEDDLTQEVIAILAERTRSGVKVFVLVDGIGSRLTRGEALEQLRDAGIRCESFLAPSIFKGRFQVNFRNHRKLAVIDGTSAFTGGRNFGADYFDDGVDGIRDLSIAVRGPAVAALRRLFFEDWSVATEDADAISVTQAAVPEPAGEVPMRVIPHGCDEERDAYLPIVSAAIRSAQKQVVIVTPYLIPGPMMGHDLRMAALTGVDVRILMPERSPERWPEIAARRFFEPLLEAGVGIWIKPLPFVHAKAIVVDGRWSVVGSANFDERSFFLNYELSCEIPDRDFASALLDYFAPDFESSERIDRDVFDKRPGKQRIVENAAALFAPIL